MYYLKVEKECACFKKSDFDVSSSFDTKVNALMKAVQMSNQMNNLFCGEHNFIVEEEGNTLYIKEGEARATSGCCGRGCCMN